MSYSTKISRDVLISEQKTAKMVILTPISVHTAAASNHKITVKQEI